MKQKLTVHGLIAFFLMLSFSLRSQTPTLLDKEPEFKIFPNPNDEESETYLSLQGFKAMDLLVVVYDMLGREIYSKVEVRETEGFLFTLASEGKTLPTGIYLITASANDKVFRQKLIVK
ncbi:MAG TPA: T9SS type A sorting domain-containing protein [Bacteroidia bacterium]|jgi:hypothetical protein